MKTRARYLIPAVLVVAMLFAACGRPGGEGSDLGAGGGSSDSSKGDDGVTTDPAGSTCPVSKDGSEPDCPVSSGTEPIVVDPGEDQQARIVPITPGLQNVNMTVFDRHKVLEGDRLKLFFWGGVEDCYGVDHVDIEYGNDVVIATIFYGNKPDAEMCIEIAEYQAVVVRLDEPLGGRDIVDGGLAAT
jgi:predicted small secreted protein